MREKAREMTPGPQLDEIARLLGDRSRAVMLGALMDGRQWTGRELAGVANVTPSTASSHLQRLVAGDIICAVAHGRHKYYRISRPDVAQALETLMNLAPKLVPRHVQNMDAKLRRLRTCYDHLAGQIAVDLCEALVARNTIAIGDESGSVTLAGMAFFAQHGIKIDANGRRPMCRPCLDWSERRYHLAGRAGVALARHALENGWVTRRDGTRALNITASGSAWFRTTLGVDVSV